MKTKVLSLPSPFRYDKESWDFVNGEEGLGDGYKPIQPVFNRHGWYYDRETKRSWIECEHGCWEEKSPEMFLYILKIKSCVFLPRKVLKAIKTLRHYNMCPKQLVDLVWTDSNARTLIDIKRGKSVRK